MNKTVFLAPALALACACGTAAYASSPAAQPTQCPTACTWVDESHDGVCDRFADRQGTNCRNQCQACIPHHGQGRFHH